MADWPVATLTTAAILTAINSAARGDTVTLTANALYSGTLVLPVKAGFTGANFITIRSTPNGGLPTAGTRISLAQQSLMAKIRPPQDSGNQNTPCIEAAVGAVGYKIDHVEFAQTYYGSGNMVEFGNNTDAFVARAHQPDNLHLRACIFNGAFTNALWLQKRGVSMHGKNLSVTDCYFHNMGGPSNSTDSQCVWVQNGEGPYTITNNYMEGCTMQFLTGGDQGKMRTVGTIAASPAPTLTSCRVNVTTPDRDNPVVADTYLAFVCRDGAWRSHALCASVTVVNSTTLDLTFAATGEMPTVGGDIRWGVIPKDITFEYNHLTKPIAWLGATMVPTPAGVTAVASSGGSLTAGTYVVRVAARLRSQGGVYIASTASTAITVNVAANEKITVTYGAVSVAEEYRVYMQHPTASWYHNTVAAGTLTSIYSATGTSNSGVAGGNTWSVKCAWELKCGINVTHRYNIVENSWPGTQGGWLYWLKTTNNSAGTYASAHFVTKNVTIEYNIWRHCAGFILISGNENESGDNSKKPRTMSELTIRHNLGYDSGSAQFSQGKLIHALNLSNGTHNLTFDHNTLIHAQYGAALLVTSSTRENWFTNLVFTNNIQSRWSYGWWGSNSTVYTGEGTPAIAAYTQNSYTWTNNVMAAGTSNLYPAGNLFPSQATLTSTYFTDFAGGDYSLKVSPASPAIGAGTSGSNIGADIATILTNTQNVISGTTTPPAAVLITTATLPTGVVNTPYTATVSVIGGASASYTISKPSGTLPTGLTYAATAPAGNFLISGTPTVAGTASFTLRATDTSAGFDDQAFTLRIDAIVTPVLTIVPMVLPVGYVNSSYTAQLEAAGGMPPYAWGIIPTSQDELPEGLVLESDGTITGIPTGAGSTSVIEFEVHDLNGSAATITLGLVVTALESYIIDLDEIDRLALQQRMVVEKFLGTFAEFVATVAARGWLPIRVAYDERRGAAVKVGYVANDSLAARRAAERSINITES